MDRFKSEYERALRPAVMPPVGTNRSGRVRVQKGDVVKRMETWVQEVYLPEQEVNLRLLTWQAGRWSNEIQRAQVALQAYLKRHPDAPSTHRPGANPPQVEDLLQRLERVRTEGINLLRQMVDEEAILAVAPQAPPEALSQPILGKYYLDYKQPYLSPPAESSPQRFESIKTNMAAWLKDDFLPEKERSLREMQAEYTRRTNEVAKLEAELEEVRAKGGGPSQMEARLKGQPTPSPDLVVKVFALKYAQAAEAAASLQPLVSADFKIVADTRINALLVHGPESKFVALEAVIRKIDSAETTPPKDVSPSTRPARSTNTVLPRF